MKTATSMEAVLETSFRVDSIARTAAPEGSDGIWHQYIISQGSNTITGVRAGTYQEVSVLLDQMVGRLNERRFGNSKPKSR